MTRRSVIRGVGSALPKRRVSNEELAQTSTPPTSGSSSAPDPEPLCRRRRRDHREPGDRRRAARARSCRPRRDRHRSHRARHRDARPDLPIVRDQGPGGARHRRLHRLRRPRGVHRLPLRLVGRGFDARARAMPAKRWSSARRRSAGSSTGRIAGPASCSETAPARWCLPPRKASAESSRPSSTPTDITTTCCSSTAGFRPRDRRQAG